MSPVFPEITLLRLTNIICEIPTILYYYKYYNDYYFNYYYNNSYNYYLYYY